MPKQNLEIYQKQLKRCTRIIEMTKVIIINLIDRNGHGRDIHDYKHPKILVNKYKNHVFFLICFKSS